MSESDPVQGRRFPTPLDGNEFHRPFNFLLPALTVVPTQQTVGFVGGTGGDFQGSLVYITRVTVTSPVGGDDVAFRLINPDVGNIAGNGYYTGATPVVMDYHFPGRLISPNEIDRGVTVEFLNAAAALQHRLSVMISYFSISKQVARKLEMPGA